MNSVRVLVLPAIALSGFGLILGLLLLFAAASSQSASVGTPGAGAGLNTGRVPAAYIAWVEQAGSECAAVSPPQIAAQIQQESGWNPNAVSSAGADGIAQFLPGTFAVYGVVVDGKPPASIWDPADAIVAMGRYDCAIAAAVAAVPGNATSNMLAGYNAGVGAVLAFHGIPPFAQTEAYVQDIEAMIPNFEAATSTASSSFATAEIQAAEKWVGTPYVWGGGSPTGPTTGADGTTAGFDCSGLVMYAVYQASGGSIVLPHSSEQDATLGTAVAPADLQPGDVIAIQVIPGDFSHIVIYVGGGMIVEAPTTGENVKIAPLSDFAGDVEAIRRFG